MGSRISLWRGSALGNPDKEGPNVLLAELEIKLKANVRHRQCRESDLLGLSGPGGMPDGFCLLFFVCVCSATTQKPKNPSWRLQQELYPSGSNMTVRLKSCWEKSRTRRRWRHKDRHPPPRRVKVKNDFLQVQTRPSSSTVIRSQSAFLPNRTKPTGWTLIPASTTPKTKEAAPFYRQATCEAGRQTVPSKHSHGVLAPQPEEEVIISEMPNLLLQSGWAWALGIRQMGFKSGKEVKKWRKRRCWINQSTLWCVFETELLAVVELVHKNIQNFTTNKIFNVLSKTKANLDIFRIIIKDPLWKKSCWWVIFF